MKTIETIYKPTIRKGCGSRRGGTTGHRKNTINGKVELIHKPNKCPYGGDCFHCPAPDCRYGGN
jgi:hypothetical protein